MTECYFTPFETINEVLNLDILSGVERILEPAAGDGRIVSALRTWGYAWHITAIELEPQYRQLLSAEEPDEIIIDTFLREDINVETLGGSFDLVITNPPFSKIEDFITKTHELITDNGKIVMLLRMSALSGIKRGKFLKKYTPTSVHLLSQRPAFPNFKGADNCGYAWVIWDQTKQGQPTTLTWLDPSNPFDRRANNGGKRGARYPFTYRTED
jgi:hypothetical protein